MSNKKKEETDRQTERREWGAYKYKLKNCVVHARSVVKSYTLL